MSMSSYPESVSVTIYDKRGFFSVIKFRVLRWGNDPALSESAKYNPNGPYKRDAGGSEEVIG